MGKFSNCPNCGLRYTDMKTGLTFESVRRMMFTGSNDPADWRHKRRHSVLGFWRELKIMYWNMHLGECS